MARYQWDQLNKQQVGAYAEYFVKMELTMFGFQVYSTEVDDRGIDFVARHGSGPFIEAQVKALRGPGYVFMKKSYFKPSETLHLALVMLKQGEAPDLYLIPSSRWVDADGVFVSRDYGEGLKSAPEWGLNLSRRNMWALEKFRFEQSASLLIA
jgi:hypothetical protein